MKIAIASDHAGFQYKQALIAWLRELGHVVNDCGTDSSELVDYPDFIHPAADAVASGQAQRGIVLGGSGNGEAMAANRHAGVRCALCWNEESARLARRHNDANMLALGERLLTYEMAQTIVNIWLTTPFEGGRHTARIRKIEIAGARHPA